MCVPSHGAKVLPRERSPAEIVARGAFRFLPMHKPTKFCICSCAWAHVHAQEFGADLFSLESNLEQFGQIIERNAVSCFLAISSPFIK